MSRTAVHPRRHLRLSYSKRARALLRHPFFWFLTISGNTLILIGGVFIHWGEAEVQNQPFGFMDSLLWSTGLVTTIGYGGHLPLTFTGKVTVLVLMLLGTLFIWAYMAFVVTALISPELSSLEKDLNEVEREILILKQMEETKKNPS